MRIDIALWISISLLSAFSSAQAQDAAKGEKLFSTCIQCHGDKGQGLAEKNAPHIAGQYDWYILSSLKAFKAGERKNPEMLPYIKGLSEQDFADLAAYVSKMAP
ncbi:MAG: cytochrome C [Bdellovibrionales bacterium CG12_big_fil_rev_8_21_14_0_65_38_15]|nr:MAG: cytochrome C [Bdellovibrionales bacterium CG22_combo_CG10-13_8_21_14_all_38_13]PIQ55731.1 MAG: cytochrome C [Bdellovibrionales bacterium CG12_big_fil_rev_8_21_14_0_65_38_15]PIR30741.1 MAG: cytochrome C [Bdellovibrionales bacterium CG11_big_fil_rev_8_21_14_0_20_38_13]